MQAFSMKIRWWKVITSDRGSHIIVADSWAVAYNPHSHPNPPHTH